MNCSGRADMAGTPVSFLSLVLGQERSGARMPQAGASALTAVCYNHACQLRSAHKNADGLVYLLANTSTSLRTFSVGGTFPAELLRTEPPNNRVRVLTLFETA